MSIGAEGPVLQVSPADAPAAGLAPPAVQAGLADILKLHAVSEGVFEARHSQRNPGGTIFGGALIGQLMAAASQGRPAERAAHHVQLSFLAPGQVGEPVRFEVRTLLEGRSFTIVQVTGSQGARAVVTGQVSFQRDELGPDFQQALAQAPAAPESLPSLHEVIERNADRMGASARRLKPLASIDMRLPDHGAFLFERRPDAKLSYWIKARERLPAEPALHACALGFLSDYWFPATAMTPHLDHKFGHGLHVTSLNHCLWLHRPVKADEWLYIQAHSPASTGARGLSLAHVHDRGGRLLASLSQENLFRGWITEGESLVTPNRQPAV